MLYFRQHLWLTTR